MVGRTEILKNPTETQIALLMAKIGTFPTIKKNDKLKHVIELMLTTKRSKLPVVDTDGETLVGILSISDIVWKLVPESEITKKVNDYYVNRIAVVYDGTPANVCAKVLSYAGQESLPVVND